MFFNIVAGNEIPVLTNPSTYKVPVFMTGIFAFKGLCSGSSFRFRHPSFWLRSSSAKYINMSSRYFAIYKPYMVLSQFSKEGDKVTLKDHFDVPVDVYPVGRLDQDSEGLLILTNDKLLNHRLLHPSFAHEREYWVQVEGDISKEAIDRLMKGVQISIDGKSYVTKPCKVVKQKQDLKVPERVPPIRERKLIPTSWIRLILTEGKNRQVRKMTAAVGFPTLRLIRYRVCRLNIEGMLPGDIRELSHGEMHKELFG